MGSDDAGRRRPGDGDADADSHVCPVCGAAFDSAAALHDHVYSLGQLY